MVTAQLYTCRFVSSSREKTPSGPPAAAIHTGPLQCESYGCLHSLSALPVNYYLKRTLTTSSKKSTKRVLVSNRGRQDKFFDAVGCEQGRDCVHEKWDYGGVVCLSSQPPPSPSSLRTRRLITRSAPTAISNCSGGELSSCDSGVPHSQTFP